MSNEIPDADFIIRYCKPNTIAKNQIISTTFDTRPNENHVSTNWFSQEINPNIKFNQIRSILTHKKFKVNSNGKFVIFNTGIMMVMMVR